MNYKIRKIENLLKEKDYKITNARKEIIDLFVYNKNKHYMTHEIYDLLKAKNISLPTVYRTVEILKNNGIIKETIIDKKRYYELKMFSEKSVHGHLKCMECGKIFDYLDINSILLLLKEKNKIEKRYDIIINDIYTIFYGICKDCRR